jgi:hypothetical protein
MVGFMLGLFNSSKASATHCIRGFSGARAVLQNVKGKKNIMPLPEIEL